MKSKDKILHAAFKLFLEKGLQATSMKDILKESGVSNGTLYHHFSSREKIVEALYLGIQDKLFIGLSETTRDAIHFKEFLWLSWKSVIHFYFKHPEYYLFMKRFKDSMIVENCFERSRTLGYNVEKYEEALKRDIIDIPSIEYFNIMYSASLYGAIDYLKIMNMNDDSEMTEILFNKFWRLIAKF